MTAVEEMQALQQTQRETVDGRLIVCDGSPSERICLVQFALGTWTDVPGCVSSRSSIDGRVSCCPCCPLIPEIG